MVVVLDWYSSKFVNNNYLLWCFVFYALSSNVGSHYLIVHLIYQSFICINTIQYFVQPKQLNKLLLDIVIIVKSMNWIFIKKQFLNLILTTPIIKDSIVLIESTKKVKKWNKSSRRLQKIRFSNDIVAYNPLPYLARKKWNGIKK